MGGNPLEIEVFGTVVIVDMSIESPGNDATIFQACQTGMTETFRTGPRMIVTFGFARIFQFR